MFVGLRPRAPLPPEPSAYTTGSDPLACARRRTSPFCACARIRPRMTDAKHVQDAFDRATRGGPARHHEKSEEQGKLPVRERVARLLDAGSFTEDALLANWEAGRARRRRRRHRHGHDRRAARSR